MINDLFSFFQSTLVLFFFFFFCEFSILAIDFIFPLEQLTTILSDLESPKLGAIADRIATKKCMMSVSRLTPTVTNNKKKKKKDSSLMHYP